MQNTSIRQSLDIILLIILSMLALGFGLYMAITHPHITVRYDCSIAEISPDIPVQVKEACRKLRAHNF
jgi:hypothetical protein